MYKDNQQVLELEIEELLAYNIGDEVEILLVGETEDGEFIIGSRRRIDMEDNLKN